jgi:hypothetical protein
MQIEKGFQTFWWERDWNDLLLVVQHLIFTNMGTFVYFFGCSYIFIMVNVTSFYWLQPIKRNKFKSKRNYRPLGEREVWTLLFSLTDTSKWCNCLNAWIIEQSSTGISSAWLPECLDFWAESHSTWTSEQSPTVPGSGTLKHSQALSSTHKHSQALSGNVRHSQELSSSSRQTKHSGSKTLRFWY